MSEDTTTRNVIKFPDFTLGGPCTIDAARKRNQEGICAMLNCGQPVAEGCYGFGGLAMCRACGAAWEEMRKKTLEDNDAVDVADLLRARNVAGL